MVPVDPKLSPIGGFGTSDYVGSSGSMRFNGSVVSSDHIGPSDLQEP